MELIEVQHCHETVRQLAKSSKKTSSFVASAGVWGPNKCAGFQLKSIVFKDLCPSKFLRYLTKAKIMKCTISLNCDDVDVEFLRSRTS